MGPPNLPAIDLKHDPAIVAASARAGELYKRADDAWRDVRARILARAQHWEHATGMWHSPPGNPLWPEIVESARGRLVGDESAAHSYGFDAQRRLVVWREREQSGFTMKYYEYGDNGWSEWVFSEVPERNHVRKISAGVGWFAGDNAMCVAKARYGESRILTHREGKQLDVWEANSLQPGMEGEDFDRPVHRTARLGPNDHPIVVKENDFIIFKKAKGNFDKQLERLKKTLLREIPKQVAKEHAGHELYAVCLSYGEDEELLPPAVIGCRVEDFEKLGAEPGRHWDAGPLWDLREPIHVDGLSSVQKALEPVSYHLIEPANVKKAEAMLVELARELNTAKWPKKVKLAPGFVVYPANAEGGDFDEQLRAVLDEPTRKVLEDKGWLS